MCRRLKEREKEQVGKDHKVVRTKLGMALGRNDRRGGQHDKRKNIND